MTVRHVELLRDAWRFAADERTHRAPPDALQARRVLWNESRQLSDACARERLDS
jgi:hypothetical protein